MVFFFLVAVGAFLYHVLGKGVRTLKTLCKRASFVRFVMEERRTMYIVRTFGENSHNMTQIVQTPLDIAQSACELVEICIV